MCVSNLEKNLSEPKGRLHSMPASTKAIKLNVIPETVFSKIENKMAHPSSTYFSKCFWIILQQILPFACYLPEEKQVNYTFWGPNTWAVFVHVSVFSYFLIWEFTFYTNSYFYFG